MSVVQPRHVMAEGDSAVSGLDLRTINRLFSGTPSKQNPQSGQGSNTTISAPIRTEPSEVMMRTLG